MSKLLGLWDDLTGVVLDYALSTPPSGEWLMCYGQALPDADPACARLRSKLIADGYPHGMDGSNNPKVPDARGRVCAGMDAMGGAAAGRLTAAGGGVSGNSLGAAGGAQSVTLTTAQMPSHSHTVNDSGHTHPITVPSGTAQAGALTADAGVATAERNTGSAVTGITLGDTGGGLAHSNTQPTLVLNKIIRL